LIDSANFVAMRLSQFPKTFGLEAGPKGIFPYRFNSRANFAYVGAIPPIDEFLPQGDLHVPAESKDPEATRQAAAAGDSRAQAQIHTDEVYAWHREFHPPRLYSLAAEREMYAKQDGRLLAQGMELFRAQFEEMTRTTKWHGAPTAAVMVDESGDPAEDKHHDDGDDGEQKRSADGRGVDPLQYATMASACHAALRHAFLEENTIAYVERASGQARESLAAQWIRFMRNEGVYLPEPYRGTSFVHHGVAVDVLVHPNAYRLLDCVDDGCPRCFPKRRMQRQRVLTDVQRLRGLVQCTLHTTYRCELLRDRAFRAWRRSDTGGQVQTPEDPIVVRDAFFGGRTNAVRLHAHTLDDHERIGYVDFVSLYPYVNKNGWYPIGHPEHVAHPTVEAVLAKAYFGLIKCRVVPPRGLFHPVLPVRLHGKLMFPLCFACACHATEQVCPHGDDERAILGTWTSCEVYAAVEVGYRIAGVYAVDHFREKRRGLFASYVNTFMRAKEESSGWPKVCVFFYRLVVDRHPGPPRHDHVGARADRARRDGVPTARVSCRVAAPARRRRRTCASTPRTKAFNWIPRPLR
jgi:hypothetical protein